MKRLSVLLTALALTCCSADYVTRDEAQVILQITKITGQAGGGGGQSGDVLISDVQPNFNDNAALTFSTFLKNPRNTSAGPSNGVFLERYEVRFIRSDGRDVQGVDVPYAFSGAMGTFIAVGQNASAAIILVRHQAKAEPPLLNLVSSTPNGDTVEGAFVLTCIAEITVYGHTVNGIAVTATGSLTISFADFAEAT